MKILVTGAAGYIGSVLVGELLRHNHSVIALDNFMYNQISLLEYCNQTQLEIVRGDARDKNLMERLLKNTDAIFPLACLTGAPLCQRYPWEAQTIIVDAVRMLLELRSAQQIIIFPTTNSGYGIGQKGIPCTEESALHPISLYAQLKVDVEKILLAAGNCITLRLATAFGISPRMRLDLLVNDLTYKAVTDRYVILFEPHFKRNFIHVRDIAKAFLHGLTHFEQMKNQSYNVGLSDTNLSKWELCAEIKKQLPGFIFLEAPIGEDPDKRDYIVSNEKIEQTGFKPDFSLQDGIRELIKGYQVIRRNQFSNV